MIEPTLIKLVINGPYQVAATFRLDSGIAFSGSSLARAEQLVRKSDNS